MMPAHTGTAFAAFGQPEQQAVTLSDEERERLAEIHELINLLAAELTRLSQTAAGDYGFPPLPAQPAVPYSYSFYEVPQAIRAFAGLPRF